MYSRQSKCCAFQSSRTAKPAVFKRSLRHRSRQLIQVCESMVEPKTRKREVAALSEAMAEHGLKNGMIITRNEDEVIKVDNGKIEKQPDISAI
jgi:hypothetical protein